MKLNQVTRPFFIILPLFALFSLSGCFGTKQTTEQATEQRVREDALVVDDNLKKALDAYKAEMKEEEPDQVSVSGTTEVSGCSVVATVIEIYPDLDLKNPNTPCGKVPCGALIRIDEIVKMGSMCSPAIVPGAELKVFFQFTLSKTDDLFPDMKKHFTGLEKNDTFAATFVTTAHPEDEYQAVIYVYTKAE